MSISSVRVEIRINHVNRVDILGLADRTLYLGASIRLIAEPYLDNEPLSPSLCPFTYIWGSTQENVLRVDKIL